MAKRGKVIIPAGLHVWEHELRTTQALAQAGYIVEFLDTKVSKYSKSADILMDNSEWEIKSPSAQKLSAVERNLKRANHQSTHVIFDSQRMGRLPDKSIEKELVKQLLLTKTIKQILFVNRKRQVIDISTR